MTLLMNSTTVALWHDIIHEAETSCALKLKEDVESYLVYLLIRYTNKPEVIKQIIATDMLQGAKLASSQRELALQEVGDKCLIFSGLFPKLAEKRFVKISYFVNMGQIAYDRISKEKSDIFYSLAKQFVGLMDLLQSLRVYSRHNPDLLPIQAYDLWNETGSQRALSVLKQYTDCTPIKQEPK